MDKIIGFGHSQSCGNRWSVGRMSVLRLCRWGIGPVSGRVVLCLDYLYIWQVLVSVYCARRIPAHLRCTQCSILLHLPTVYWSVVDTANPDLFACGCRTWICLDITGFNEQCQPSSGSAYPKTINRAPRAST